VRRIRVSLTGKWIDLIFKTATGNWKVKLVFAPITGALYLGLIALFVILSLSTDTMLGLPVMVAPPLSWYAGVPLIAAGLLLMGWCVSFFLKVRGTPVPFSPPPVLVMNGPYRYARNPMLSGIFIQLFGFGVFFGSLSLVLFFTPLFILINVWELKHIEEPELAKRLGDDYLAYKRRVPMFFPHFRAGS
jgi:protein-S-isoprenylcysteine O-methyltransferase Ste14